MRITILILAAACALAEDWPQFLGPTRNGVYTGNDLAAYDASGWYGMLAPRRTPTPVINKLNLEVARILSDPAVRKKLTGDGADVVSARRRTVRSYESLMAGSLIAFGNSGFM